MRRRWLVAPIVLAVFVSGASTAGDASIMIRMRQARFKTLVNLHRTVKAELARPTPDAALIGRVARQEAELVRPLPIWFPAGSGPGGGTETYAMREIWTRSADFNAKAAALQTALSGLETSAQQHSPEAMRTAQQSVAIACQMCHDTYLNR